MSQSEGKAVVEPRSLRSTILEVLGQMELSYEESEAGDISLLIHEDAGFWTVRIESEDVPERRWVTVVSGAPIHVPEGRRAAVAEWTARTNFEHRFSSFGLDPRDGEVRCAAGLIVADAEFTHDMFRNLLLVNVQTMNDHLQELMQVAFGVAPASVGSAPEADAEEDGALLQ